MQAPGDKGAAEDQDDGKDSKKKGPGNWRAKKVRSYHHVNNHVIYHVIYHVTGHVIYHVNYHYHNVAYVY